ncbi:glycoside hydrolase family 3 [Georgenia subflava]|uniref:Glycoside hydrolase family 3 n=2 Tax=Georgenia subflava TaxID=1622177 RepID=A0A6N7EP87_9MICO|nr:glycoside hydrolase family 3 N-terminal domain-containing protein [Georgenia subflava]MPV38928.1 glycoside hydrolase family 3 [Georgenia subflava]
MVGQMLMVGFRGTSLAPDNPIVADLRDRHLGAVVLFAHDVPSGDPVRNIDSPQQLSELTAALQAEAHSPLLVATDQEGGRVARLGPEHGFPATASAAELGAADDPAATRQAAAAIARTLRDAGINLNLAPVVDVNLNPANPVIGALDRSFSADPAVVAEQAAAFVQGHHDEGVLTSLKHFPGHGSSRGDSHAGFVDVTDVWSPVELEPYRELIHGGLADSVMVAHVFNAELDPDLPASLSHRTITGLLRDELGYDGVVVSDDLQMRAITDGWSLEEAIRLAVLAGTDLLAFSNNIDFFTPDLGARAYDALMALVASGEVSEERLAQSYERLARLKARAG